MERQIRFRSLYEREWYYQTLEEMLTVTLAAFRNGKHKTQYTGLKDKNNKEIYEGDIVKGRTLSNINWDQPESNYQIVFKNGTFCFATGTGAIARQWNDGQNYWEGLENCESFDIEIIGNIYENPELLK